MGGANRGGMIRYGRVAAAFLVCFAGGALASIAVATQTSDFGVAAYYYCPGGGAGSNYGYCPPTTTTPPVPATLSLTPAAGTNTVGTSHTVTASVTEADGDPVGNIVVRFTVTGSVSTSGFCTTDAGGTCTFTYPGPALPGADLIEAYADTDEDNVRDPGEPEGSATKAWVLPASTPGQVTGGGQILDASGNRIAFGFTAKSNGGLKGECTVVDRTADRMLKCREVTALVQSGNQATIHGTGSDNGLDMTYVIKVVDNTESGKGNDTFSIQTSTGYSASGVLAAGNIQVHP